MRVASLLGFILASTLVIANGIYLKNEDSFLQRAEALAVAKDTELISKGQPLLNNYAKTAKDEVCYEDLGCFSKITGPFGFIDLNPENPEKLRNKFFLYTRRNKDSPVTLHYKDHNTISTGFFDANKLTVIISHGFNEDSTKDWLKQMKDSFLQKEDCNLIVVDWGRGAVLPFYGQSIVNSELVARELSVILTLLVQKRGLKVEKIYGVGYSLGAHLMGMVGKNMIKNFNKKMDRITGLDPAGPSFEDRDATVHLSKNDAKFVDIIHTSAGTSIIFGDFGIKKAIGHVDFYPNGGNNQPGCSLFAIACSHKRSVELFTESLQPSKTCQMTAFPCSGGYKAYKEGKCKDCGAGCGTVGYSSRTSKGRGTLYLTTRNASPYCLQ